MLIDKACAERGCSMHENGDECVEMAPISVGDSGDWYTIQCKDNELYIDGVFQAVNKLYLKVPKREWVGLTEQDVHDAFQFTELIKQLNWRNERPEWCENFAAYIEARLKEKNT